MTVRDVFGLIVRLAGVAMIFFAMFDFAHIVMAAIGLPITQQYALTTEWAGVVSWGVFGVATLAGAELLTRLVYGRGD